MIKLLQKRIVIWPVTFSAPVAIQPIGEVESVGMVQEISFNMHFDLTDADMIAGVGERVYDALAGKQDDGDNRTSSARAASIIFPLACGWGGVGAQEGGGAAEYSEANLAALFRTYPSAFEACYFAYIRAYNGRAETRKGNSAPPPEGASDTAAA